MRGWIPIERPQQDAVKRFRWHDKDGNMLKHVGGIEMAAEFSSSVLESILREERMPASVLSSGSSTFPSFLMSYFLRALQIIDNKVLFSHVWIDSVASTKKCNIRLRIDNLSFPLESLLHHGSPRNASAKCYVTYKFFDQGYFWFSTQNESNWL